MTGVHDINKVDQVNGKYDAKTDTYTNSDITLDYSANLRTVHVHYINQHGQDLNSNNTDTNTISGNVGEMLIPNEITDKVAMPAGYHLVKGDSNVVIQASGSSDVNYQIQGNAVKFATIEINYDHDGKLNKSKIIKVNLNGKHIGDSDVIVDPLQYQPTNDTYHMIALDQPIFIQMKANDFNQNGDYLPRKHFTYDATTAAPLIIRYVDIDEDARPMSANGMDNGHPIIASDVYQATQLEQRFPNLDWVVGNHVTVGTHDGHQVLDLIQAPTGYDLINDSNDFAKTIRLTKGSTLSNGRHAMVLMVRLGASPYFKPSHFHHKSVNPTRPKSSSIINPKSRAANSILPARVPSMMNTSNSSANTFISGEASAISSVIQPIKSESSSVINLESHVANSINSSNPSSVITPTSSEASSMSSSIQPTIRQTKPVTNHDNSSWLNAKRSINHQAKLIFKDIHRRHNSSTMIHHSLYNNKFNNKYIDLKDKSRQNVAKLGTNGMINFNSLIHDHADFDNNLQHNIELPKTGEQHQAEITALGTLSAMLGGLGAAGAHRKRRHDN